MSIYKSYSPRTLWLSTLKLVDAFFHVSPQMPTEPASFFSEVMRAHELIRKDIQSNFEDIPVHKYSNATLEQIHGSLVQLSKMILGEEFQYPVSIKGCQLYTEEIERKLSTNYFCVIH